MSSEDPVIITDISEEPLDVSRLLEPLRLPHCGGLVVFEGMTRTPSADGDEVLRLEYEANGALARTQLQEIAQAVAAEHGAHGVLAVHRTGDVAVTESSIVVAAAAPHRDVAFAAARDLIERVKRELAVWKKEICSDGEAWVGMPPTDQS